MAKYKLIDGSVITDEDIDKICSDMDKGVLPGSEWSGPTIIGRPLLFNEPMKQIGFRETESKIAAIDARAASLGMKRSDYLRYLVDQDLEKQAS